MRSTSRKISSSTKHGSSSSTCISTSTYNHQCSGPRSELLGVGDGPVPHWAKVMIMMAAAVQGTFQYPAGHARAGQLDESATGVFKSWLMTTVESDSDLMAGTMSLTGPGNNEEEKLNGAEFRVPDDLPPHWVAFENATALQCRNHLSRKCAEAVTVSSMVQDMRSGSIEERRLRSREGGASGRVAGFAIAPWTRHGPRHMFETVWFALVLRFCMRIDICHFFSLCTSCAFPPPLWPPPRIFISTGSYSSRSILV